MTNESADSKTNETAAPRMERRENAQGAITDNKGSISQAAIHDRTGLYIAILAFGAAILALGMVIERGSSSASTQRLEDQAVDGRIAAAVERSRADMQGQIAQAQAVANLYRTEAMLTKTNLEELHRKLNAKGINVGTLDGH